MILARATRGFRPCLLILFVVSQVLAVTSLIYNHTLNLYETTPVVTHAHPHAEPTVAHPDADHHHGVLDLRDQCCTLHGLAGPVPHMIDVAPGRLASVRIVLAELIALTGGNPGVLDRPPRPLPLS
jgi:hypothetical protein